MPTYDIRDATRNLSLLIDDAIRSGEPFVIENDGKPLVKVVPIDSARTLASVSRVGFMKGQIRVPADFDALHADTIRNRFDGSE